MLVVKNPHANVRDIRDQEDLGQEDPLVEGLATHSNILAWNVMTPMDRGAW